MAEVLAEYVWKLAMDAEIQIIEKTKLGTWRIGLYVGRRLEHDGFGRQKYKVDGSLEKCKP